ncbi:MAG: 3-methyl-2-oxobutanoate hydroxymethyltransferase [Proteobacteria bacterium]|nr:3-methyl-2-oxobutanoate hydroxymethyltransferase [Pseudomonadota bacterium]
MAMTIADLKRMKTQGERISMLTAYDATFARLVEAAGIEVILIGDSLGNVMQGRSTTVPVTVEDIIYHSRCVMRACQRPFVVADLPFGSYQASLEDGLRAAFRLMKEGGVHGVKLEGGERCVPLTQALTQAGVPVMGHLGLTPQSVHQLSGYRVQGKEAQAAEALLQDAQSLQEAGAFSIVLECVPRQLAARVTQALHIPTIGIGAGPDCDGQVLVLQDCLGMGLEKPAKFVRPFAMLGETAIEAFKAYAHEVRSGTYPNDGESYH